MRVRSVLLDVDGTLVDSNEMHVTAWRRAFNESDIALAAERVRKQIGKGADMLIPALAPETTGSVRDRIAKRHGEIFKNEMLSQVQAFPGAHDLIKTLHEMGQQVVIASSADQREVDHYIQLLGVKHMLTDTTSADDVKRSKPAADIFAVALHKTEAKDPAAAIAIGDTPYDIISAGKNGIRTIAVLSGGFTESELSQEKPLAIYEDVADLVVQVLTSPLGF